MRHLNENAAPLCIPAALPGNPRGEKTRPGEDFYENDNAFIARRVSVERRGRGLEMGIESNVFTLAFINQRTFNEICEMYDIDTGDDFA